MLHAGHVEVTTVPGHGTTVRVILPRAPLPSAPPRVLPREEVRTPTTSLRILVVESDPSAREFLRTCLAEDGHQVAVAANGAEAIGWCRTSDSPLDVLVTDLFLPDVNALEIATLLREQSPDLRLVLLSDGQTRRRRRARGCSGGRQTFYGGRAVACHSPGGPSRHGGLDPQPSARPVDSVNVTPDRPTRRGQAAATMQKGSLRASENADASLREMLAHLNVIDAGIARIGESNGTEVTGAARDLLSRLELIAFLAARVQVHEVHPVTDSLEELVLAAQLQPLRRPETSMPRFDTASTSLCSHSRRHAPYARPPRGGFARRDRRPSRACRSNNQQSRRDQPLRIQGRGAIIESPPAMFPPVSPSVLLITSRAQFDAAEVRASSADAIVVQATENDRLLSAVLTTRADLPIVVLQDVDEAGALALIAQGADDVLRAAATVPEIASAVRFAMARRQRTSPRRTSTSQAAVSFPDAPHLQAIARLSGGIAHEFNNLLTVVEAHVEQLRQGLPDPTDLRTAADGIAAAAREAAMLTRQLLAFGRQQTLMPAPVEMNGLIADAAPSLRARLGEASRLSPSFHGTCRRSASIATRCWKSSRTSPRRRASRCRGRQLHHRHRRPRGHRRRTASSPVAAGRTFRAAAGHRYRSRHGGTGASARVRAVLCASPSGRGKGLTMSSVYGVVKQSGGYIWADSRVDKGTTVTILLPPRDNGPGAARRTTGEAGTDSLSRADRRRHRRGPADADQHAGVARLLGTAASTGEEALEFARTLRFDLLLTDVALPGRSGPELAREFRQTLRAFR